MEAIKLCPIGHNFYKYKEITYTQFIDFNATSDLIHVCIHYPRVSDVIN